MVEAEAGDIEMQPMPVAQTDASSDSNLTESVEQSIEFESHKRAKEFMKTPCGHRYHPQCLRRWMDHKLECPTCRQAIPAIPEDQD